MSKSKLTYDDFKGWKYQKVIGLPLYSKVFDVYPALKIYPEINVKNWKVKRLTREKVIRYTMIYYSYNILHSVITEVPRRKKEAALLAGFKLNKDGRFGPDVEEMLLCKIPVINRMIVRFIRRSENSSFLQLCVFEEARSKQMQMLVDGIEGNQSNTKIIIDNVKTLSADIDKLKSELLNDDDNVDMREMMYNEIEWKNLGISPEDIAELTKDDTIDDVLPSPYVHVKNQYKSKLAQKQIG